MRSKLLFATYNNTILKTGYDCGDCFLNILEARIVPKMW